MNSGGQQDGLGFRDRNLKGLGNVGTGQRKQKLCFLHF